MTCFEKSIGTIIDRDGEGALVVSSSFEHPPPEGSRLWMRFDRTGVMEVVECDKSTIIKRSSVPARDLRILGPVFSHSSNILVLTWRSLLVMSREWKYYWLRLILYMILTLCIGTLYSGLGHSLSSVATRVAAVFVFVSFASLHSFATTMLLCCVHLMLVFPIVFYPLRINIGGLMFPSAPSLTTSNVRFGCLTVGLISVIFLGANFIPSIWDAFQFTSACVFNDFGRLLRMMMSLVLLRTPLKVHQWMSMF